MSHALKAPSGSFVFALRNPNGETSINDFDEREVSGPFGTLEEAEHALTDISADCHPQLVGKYIAIVDDQGHECDRREF